MDKYKNYVKIEEIREMLRQGRNEEALELTDGMDPRKIKGNFDCSVLAQVYLHNGMLSKAKECFEIMYERQKSRRVVMELVNLSIRLKQADEAEEYYKEYKELAAGDYYNYIFRYKIDRLKNKPLEELAASLEALKDAEFFDNWGYELAKVYHKMGEVDKCVSICDEVILWFGDGEFVERAKALKAYYKGELTFKEMSEKTVADKLVKPVPQENNDEEAAKKAAEEKRRARRRERREAMQAEAGPEQNMGETKLAAGGWITKEALAEIEAKEQAEEMKNAGAEQNAAVAAADTKQPEPTEKAAEPKSAATVEEMLGSASGELTDDDIAKAVEAALREENELANRPVTVNDRDRSRQQNQAEAGVKDNEKNVLAGAADDNKKAADDDIKIWTGVLDAVAEEPAEESHNSALLEVVERELGSLNEPAAHNKNDKKSRRERKREKQRQRQLEAEQHRTEREAEERRKAEEERAQTEAEKRAEIEAEERRKAEEERAQTEAEKRAEIEAEERRRAEEERAQTEAEKRAEAEAEERRKAEEERAQTEAEKRAEAEAEAEERQKAAHEQPKSSEEEYLASLVGAIFDEDNRPRTANSEHEIHRSEKLAPIEPRPNSCVAAFFNETRTTMERYFGFFAYQPEIAGQLLSVLEAILNPKGGSISYCVFGERGAGKKIIVNGLTGIMKTAGILGNTPIIWTDAAKVNEISITDRAPKLVSRCFAVDRAGNLSAKATAEITDICKKYGDSASIVLMDYRRNLSEIFKGNTSLNEAFTLRITIPNFGQDDLLRLAEYKLEKAGLQMENAAYELLTKRIRCICRATEEGGLARTEKYIAKVIDSVEQRNAKAFIKMTMEGGEHKQDNVVLAEDISEDI